MKITYLEQLQVREVREGGNTEPWKHVVGRPNLKRKSRKAAHGGNIHMENFGVLQEQPIKWEGTAMERGGEQGKDDTIPAKEQHA